MSSIDEVRRRWAEWRWICRPCAEAQGIERQHLVHQGPYVDKCRCGVETRLFVEVSAPCGSTTPMAYAQEIQEVPSSAQFVTIPSPAAAAPVPCPPPGLPGSDAPTSRLEERQGSTSAGEGVGASRPASAPALSPGQLLALDRLEARHTRAPWRRSCSCGAVYSLAEWMTLAAPPAGAFQADDDGKGQLGLLLKNCPRCHSTMCCAMLSDGLVVP